MRKTAVEWLVEKLAEKGILHSSDIAFAKNLEREQIIKAHGNKQKTKSNPGSIVTYGYTYTGEMYYNETYNK